MNRSCPECGYPLKGNEISCPECGLPLSQQTKTYTNIHHSTISHNAPTNTQNFQQAAMPPGVVYMQPTPKRDWANYIYESGVIFWKTFTKRLFLFNGRASRREYWTFLILGELLYIIPFVGFILYFLGLLFVSIRRMHDIDKSGWWSICPIVCFFLIFKKSDEGPNYYGAPEPAIDLI